MKRCVSRLTENELNLYPLKEIIEGWHFRIEEISQGYFRVSGTDVWGRSVSRDGIDPEMLLLECKADIIKMLCEE